MELNAEIFNSWHQLRVKSTILNTDWCKKYTEYLKKFPEDGRDISITLRDGSVIGGYCIGGNYYKNDSKYWFENGRIQNPSVVKWEYYEKNK